ncbi:DNA-directed RNA polymerases I and III subunit RPAC1-like [Homarus americanus]|uniref:DNA-directed RNA polymerases I and III subunit RPAC1-like n=1 Tax=Homarus americanus TaxID=6706 RepID=UPI001C44C804|nr:DNA-directed RNA polymerases I and III subunit RPAC1-like [Homarus americanus]
METGKITLQEFQLVYEKDSSNLSAKKKNKKKPNEGCSVEGQVEIIKMDPQELEIDFVGFHLSLINAYRRIILAEVATIAIEKVDIFNNTSIVQDEVLAHRLGLVPLKVDPRYFEFQNKEETEWGAQDSVQYKLNVQCTKNPHALGDETDPDTLYLNRKVLSSSLKWVPLGNQTDIFQETSMQPLHDDILLAKMNAGHEIHLNAYAVKGIGSDHAKFQPGLAWYRLLPEIELTREVEGEQAELLQKCFSSGVINVVTTPEGKKVARVNDARNDACSRNVFQYDSIKDSVKLTRKTDHVIFYVESHSALKSFEILEESVNIMIGKCDLLLAEIDKYTDSDVGN